MEEKELIDKINELQDSNAKLSRRLNEIETSVTWKSIGSTNGFNTHGSYGIAELNITSASS